MGDGGGLRKRANLVWHRRSGKDKTAWNWMLLSAIGLRQGIYFYFFPTYAQGKKVLWDGMDRAGMPFLAHVPPECLIDKNETEMQVRLRHAAGGESIVQIIGTDKYDSIRGTNPVGCVFSEFSFQDPGAWKVVQPILRENDGWAVFVYTPNGHNHAFQMHEMAAKNPKWFSSLLTIEHTQSVKKEDIDEEVALGLLDADDVAREYYCSFSGSMQGAYYGKLLEAAYTEGRISNVPWDPALPVETWWDLGMDDATTIWFVQRHRFEVRCIDYLEASDVGLPFYAKELTTRPYIYDVHVMPHDIKVRELGPGKSRREIAEGLGIRPIRVTPKWALDEGIDSVRRLIPLCWFDEHKCARGIAALSNYCKQYDDVRKVFSRVPQHNWASHGADAFRTGAVGGREYRVDREPQDTAESDYNPFK